MSEIDLRNLLMRYILHVGDCEGTAFIGDIWHSSYFSPEEHALLVELEKEALAAADERDGRVVTLSELKRERDAVLADPEKGRKG